MKDVGGGLAEGRPKVTFSFKSISLELDIVLRFSSGHAKSNKYDITGIYVTTKACRLRKSKIKYRLEA